jgi:hypothetical protein
LPVILPPSLPIIPKKRLQAKKGPPENRIKELKADPQVDSYDYTHIICKNCGRKIGMNTNYNLGAWKAHKSSCKGAPSPSVISTWVELCITVNSKIESQLILEAWRLPVPFDLGQVNMNEYMSSRMIQRC